MFVMMNISSKVHVKSAQDFAQTQTFVRLETCFNALNPAETTQPTSQTSTNVWPATVHATDALLLLTIPRVLPVHKGT